MCSVAFSSSDDYLGSYLPSYSILYASPAIQIALVSFCRRSAAALTLSCLHYGRSRHRSAPNLLNEP